MTWLSRDADEGRTVMTLKASGVIGAYALAFLLAQAPTAVVAQSACSLPVQPVCSTGVTGTETGSSKLRCESDVTKYIQDLETYRGCLKTADTNAQQKVELAQQFNDCLKEGRENCRLGAQR